MMVMMAMIIVVIVPKLSSCVKIKRIDICKVLRTAPATRSAVC